MPPDPSPATTPSRSPGVPGVDVGLMLHGIWQGFVSAVSASPWLGVILVIAVAGGVVRFVRSVIHSGPRDPVRRFSRADKAAIVGEGRRAL